MIVYVTTDDAPIAGNVWPKGTKLEAPDDAAKAAVASGIASFDAPDKTSVKTEAVPESEPDEAPKRRGRPPRES